MRSIVNQGQLFEADALLVSLKRRCNLVYRHDAEIELLVEDEFGLGVEFLSNSTNDENASI